MTARFMSALQVARRDPPDAGQWELLQPLLFDSDVLRLRVVVPAGFVTDFASVPRLPLAYALFGNVGDEAAVVHDFLYSGGKVPRECADAVFREAMGAMGVRGWRAWPMWLGVRLFGGSHYEAKASA